MSDLDSDLTRRLERLAAAVPVGARQLDPVHVGAVQARHQVRMRWLTPLIALVLLSLLAALLGVGGLRLFNGPVSVTTVQGDFALTITSPKAQYQPGEDIRIEGSLTYRGPGSSVDVADALGSGVGADGAVSARLVHFGVVEPVPVDGAGTVDLSGYGSRLMCDRAVMEPGAPKVVQFGKGGGTSLSIPPSWWREPLRLPAGTWHPYAVARVGLGGCDHVTELRADLEIVVSGTGPSATRVGTDIPSPVASSLAVASPTAPPTPAASPTPRPTPNPMQISKDVDGDFEFVLTSDKTVYRPGEPIRIEAALTYRGSDASIPIETDSLLIGFHLHEKVFGKIDLGPLSLLMCSTTILARDTPLIVAFPKVGGYHAGSLTASELAWLNDPVLTLPVGTWHFSAGTASPCWTPMSTKFSVGAEVTIVVRDEG